MEQQQRRPGWGLLWVGGVLSFLFYFSVLAIGSLSGGARAAFAGVALICLCGGIVAVAVGAGRLASGAR
jgi:hypothetical protein